MPEFIVEQVRNGLRESSHRVSAAVVSADGSLALSWGDPHLVTFMRSAAKPFQALPLLQDGAAERFHISPRELALVCASHNSEHTQVDLVLGLLERVGCSESDLACGPHPSLGLTYSIPPVARDLLCPPSPVANNCSGKHAGMLALARHRGWDTLGYQQRSHPVQRRITEELARWAAVNVSDIGQGVDGCTVVSFALPLSKMAGAFARLVVSSGDAGQTVVKSMTAHPELVAGRGRLCTALMQAYNGNVVAKVGAGGVYVAAIKDQGLGLCLKVEDGHSGAAMVAFLALLDSLALEPAPSQILAQFAEMPVLNTKDVQVGALRVAHPSSI